MPREGLERLGHRSRERYREEKARKEKEVVVYQRDRKNTEWYWRQTEC